VPEPQLAVPHSDQAGAFGVLQCRRLGPAGGGATQHRGDVLGVLGGGDQEQSLGSPRAW